MYAFCWFWNIGADVRLGLKHHGYKDPSGDRTLDVPIYNIRLLERQKLVAERNQQAFDPKEYDSIRVHDPNFKTTETQGAAWKMDDAFSALLDAISSGQELDQVQQTSLADMQLEHRLKPKDVLCIADLITVAFVCGHVNLSPSQLEAVHGLDCSERPREAPVVDFAGLMNEVLEDTPNTAAAAGYANAITNATKQRDWKPGDAVEGADLDAMFDLHFTAVAGQGPTGFDYQASKTAAHHFHCQLQGIDEKVAECIQPCIRSPEGHALFGEVCTHLKTQSRSKNKKLTDKEICE